MTDATNVNPAALVILMVARERLHDAHRAAIEAIEAQLAANAALSASPMPPGFPRTLASWPESDAHRAALDATNRAEQAVADAERAVLDAVERL